MTRPKTITLIVRLELQSVPGGEICPDKIILTASKRPSDQILNALALDVSGGKIILKTEVEEL